MSYSHGPHLRSSIMVAIWTRSSSSPLTMATSSCASSPAGGETPDYTDKEDGKCGFITS
jgi:hypothetical protein